MPKAAKGKDEGAKARKEPKAKRDKNAPKKPSGPYIFFCAAKRPELKAAHPDWGIAELGRELGVIWKGVSEEDKQQYYKEAEKDKERYAKEAAAYTPKDG